MLNLIKKIEILENLSFNKALMYDIFNGGQTNWFKLPSTTKGNQILLQINQKSIGWVAATH